MKNPAIEPGFLFAGDSVLLAANRTASRTTQTGTNGRTGATAELVTDQRATCRAQATTQCSFGLLAFFGCNGTTCGAAQARADSCAGAATQFLTQNVTQGTAHATAYRSLSTASRHSALGEQGAQNQDRKCFTHVANLEEKLSADCRRLSALK